MVDKHTKPDAAPPPARALPTDFEDALAELEALAGRMGDGHMSLDESIAAYERGVALARVCQQRLEAAERQVSVLQGQLLRPLDEADSPEDP
ncbi:exodeoxyribonuclease VII small subunit [Castellaniella sp. GW247-6E4]|uniref:exodeoxyribonuclease VII small subunit n=1 Tax=Castellaniella sp. GW247-6E4 TaxID=3140380 RepID=UPI003314F104